MNKPIYPTCETCIYSREGDCVKSPPVIASFPTKSPCCEGVKDIDHILAEPGDEVRLYEYGRWPMTIEDDSCGAWEHITDSGELITYRQALIAWKLAEQKEVLEKND